MAVFVVTCKTDSSVAIEEIRRLDSVKLAEGVYAVSFAGTAKELWTYFSSAAGGQTLFFVIRATSDCHGQVGEGAKFWLEKAMRAKRF